MPKEEKMTINERRKYLRLVKKRYVKATKLGRGRLPDEMGAVTRLHRRSLIRLILGSLERKPRHRQPSRAVPPSARLVDAASVPCRSSDIPPGPGIQSNLGLRRQSLHPGQGMLRSCVLTKITVEYECQLCHHCYAGKLLRTDRQWCVRNLDSPPRRTRLVRVRL
jgi:hypothetical protein